ncbi:sucrose-6-phosphate hydrolase [Pelosinus baikalensis]|uniref:Sucrose-6-phosphate hydrolase n=1 Tax=Pelosinus baikalensis TaxID=2892015 RepID=A0ABS8HYZ9_9FIRM|nr:sucrose-6-phosphate hydrolase [Pelosinus baikalensis]MCC5467729.1 sucrose-6-phosphate hydrolase [Pelosinus baikalensis]
MDFIQEKKLDKQQKAIDHAMDFIKKKGEHSTKSRWYPVYHIAAPTGWINDPNGFCFFAGKYHLFYQYHPYSAQWGPMYWGHVISEDLVHWKNVRVALAPVDEYDKDGCFSGSAITKDGKLYLLYTGHVNLPLDEKTEVDRIESQCLAISYDGITFEKIARNPVIHCPKGDNIHKGHFRDPKMWQHDEHYYTVIGAQNSKERGQVLLFESTDLEQWTFKSIMASCSGNEGYMWECPNFVEVDGQEVFIFSPQGIEPEDKKFLNHHQSGYMLGKLDYESGIFHHGAFELLDYGFDFYAPQVIQAPDGRCIMIGWLAMWESEMPEQEDGWAGIMTIPRELHMENGKLKICPIQEMENLREQSRVYENIELYEADSLDGISGEFGELLTVMDLSGTETMQINLRCSSEEETVLSYDKRKQIFSLDRNCAGKGPKGQREIKIGLQNNCLKLRIFIDKSSIEIFLNDGEAVLSARIYPNKESSRIIFSPGGGKLRLTQVAFYSLSSS